MNIVANTQRSNATAWAKGLVASLFALSGFMHSISAQEIVYPDEFATPIPLMGEVLGDFHFPISSDSELAQDFFDQGMQMMYAFAKLESARSFREAQIADPSCAICFLG